MLPLFEEPWEVTHQGSSTLKYIASTVLDNIVIQTLRFDSNALNDYSIASKCCNCGSEKITRGYIITVAVKDENGGNIIGEDRFRPVGFAVYCLDCMEARKEEPIYVICPPNPPKFFRMDDLGELKELLLE